MTTIDARGSKNSFSRMIGTITLNPSIDHHLTVRDLVKDDANRAISVVDYPGGKGINVSKVIAELGGETCAYTMTGGFSGQLLVHLLQRLCIPLASVEVSGDTRLNTILTDVRDSSQTRVSAPGPQLGPKDIAAFRKLVTGAKPTPAFWALGGSLPPGFSPYACRDLIRLLQKKGTPCVLDTDGDALKIGLQASPFMIKPNEYEMQRLVNRRLSSTGDYLRAARQMVRKGVRLAIISLGAKGAFFVTRDEAFHVIVPKVKVKSKVGAGDSLIGGTILGLSRGQTLPEAAILGAAASVSAVMREAPRLCLRSDIPGLSRRIRIRHL